MVKYLISQEIILKKLKNNRNIKLTIRRNRPTIIVISDKSWPKSSNMDAFYRQTRKDQNIQLVSKRTTY